MQILKGNHCLSRNFTRPRETHTLANRGLICWRTLQTTVKALKGSHRKTNSRFVIYMCTIIMCIIFNICE